MNIHADTVIEDLVREHPVAVRILREFDIVCIRCGEPYWGTLAELAASKAIAALPSNIHSNRTLRTILVN